MELKLSELTEKIKDAINLQLPESYWIVAEINQLNTSRGHAYLELIEKSPRSNKVLAKARATIWASTYSMLKPYFEHTTGYKFEAGIKILVSVTVSFHDVYGLSINIIDIDPVYTLGDLEKQKQLILKQLENEGVLEMNKSIPMPDVVQKIAVISSPTAAGWEDFVNQLETNLHGFKFYYKLFPAIMQGEKSEQSIIDALDNVFAYEHVFDAVVIIRGGGSKSDLSSFDTYDLALNISQFPLPVITGIGHQRDESIADIVAHTSLKTPTAVAEFLINKTENFLTLLQNKIDYLFSISQEKIQQENRNLDKNFEIITNFAKGLINSKNIELEQIKSKIKSSSKNFIKDKEVAFLDRKERLKHGVRSVFATERNKFLLQKQKIKFASRNFLSTKKHFLDITETKIELKNPKNILAKGYSIVHKEGKLVKNSTQVAYGDKITVEVYEGTFDALVD